MGYLSNITNKLSLRWRFMASPLLSLILLSLLIATFLYELRQQTILLIQMEQKDTQFDENSLKIFSALSREHLLLHNLLRNAELFDKAALYEQGKQLLYRVFVILEEFERVVSEDSTGNGQELGSIHMELLENIRAYYRAVISTVEMTMVNLDASPRYLQQANDAFNIMNQTFLEVVDFEQEEMSNEIAANIQQGETNSKVIAFIGTGAAILLLVMSFLLARILSRSLETQIKTLAELSDEAGANFSNNDNDEVGRLARAITVFKGSLLQLQKQEKALESSNRSLTGTLKELGKARDELEQRVEERTRELQQKNETLHSEVKLRKQAENHLRIYEEVIRSTGEAVVITDLQGKIVEVNQAYEHTIGRSRDELVGEQLYSDKGNRRTDKVYTELWNSLRAEGRWSGEVLDQRNNGELFPCWVLVNAVRNEGGVITHYVCVSRDITELKQSEKQLKRLAFNDSLTGLPNRALFNDRLDVAIANASRQRSKLGIMYLDLDRFKYVNDSLGHAAGDRLLVEISRRIKLCTRTSDTVARMGGDEFTVLLTHLDSEEVATNIAGRIIKAVGKPIQLDDETVYVGTSIGISFYPKDAQDAETLQKYADLTMYEAKEGGRNQYRVFNPDTLVVGADRISLSVKLESALNNNEFRLYYQPIINPGTGKSDTIEALIRWEKPGGEIVLPEKFIPYAEEAGLINKIDCWVLEHACGDIMEWRSQALELSLCVNLSALCVQQPDMPRMISEILQRTGMLPELLTLEITETAVISNPYTAQKVLREIVDLGVKLSIDDFGVSHSSLSYLTRYPISCIKLDRLFIDRIGKDKTSEEIIKSLLELARTLQLNIVAEGVEQQDQQNFLTKSGCELMQGFHFEKPMSRQDIYDWLTAKKNTTTAISS